MVPALAEAREPEWEKPVEYEHVDPISECICGADGGQHFVYVALLGYRTDDAPKERWWHDYYVFPVNRLCAWVTGSEYIHVQIAFWNKKKNTHMTFSVDKTRGKVWCYSNKKFSKSWTFHAVRVEAWQEIAMFNFLCEQLRKPFDTWGQAMWILWPLSRARNKWICSQLVLATFQAAGKYVDFDPETSHPGQVNSILERDKQALGCGHIVTLKHAEIRLKY